MPCGVARIEPSRFLGALGDGDIDRISRPSDHPNGKVRMSARFLTHAHDILRVAVARWFNADRSHHLRNTKIARTQCHAHADRRNPRRETRQISIKATQPKVWLYRSRDGHCRPGNRKPISVARMNDLQNAHDHALARLFATWFGAGDPARSTGQLGYWPALPFAVLIVPGRGQYLLAVFVLDRLGGGRLACRGNLCHLSRQEDLPAGSFIDEVGRAMAGDPCRSALGLAIIILVAFSAFFRFSTSQSHGR